MESHFLLLVLDWAAKRPTGFSYKALTSSFNFEDWQRSILDRYFENAAENSRRRSSVHFVVIPETIFYVIREGGSDYFDDNFRYILTSDALFKYIDYEELKFARENAKEAKSLALKAIRVSVAAIIISALVPVLIAQFFIQTVKLDETQIKTIESGFITPK